MDNIVSPVDLPDRRTYDAVLRTQEILRRNHASSHGATSRIDIDEVRAAIQRASHEVGANPLQVTSCITSRREHGSDIELSMAGFDQSVLSARRQLHDEAVSQNELNVEALTVVSAMDDLPVPRAAATTGSPLRDHVRRALSQVLGFDVRALPSDSGADPGQWRRSIEVARRIADFFRVVARPNLGPGDELWSVHLDYYFTIADKVERQTRVHRRVVEPAKKLIESRVAEIAAIVVETAITDGGVVRDGVSRPAARTKPGGSGQSAVSL